MVYLLLLVGRTQSPDFASTVDIHRKPGYDPVELFFDPKVRLPAASSRLSRIETKAWIPNAHERDFTHDTQLVKGSHGRVTDDLAQGPVLMCPPMSAPLTNERGAVPATHVFDTILNTIFK